MPTTTSPRRLSPSRVQNPLETYLREINETALLTANEEKELSRAITAGSNEARDRMVRANLRLVVNIARAYGNKGLPLQDLIEEGNLGLLRAVEGFDPTMGTRFSTYASYWSTPAEPFVFQPTWSSFSQSGDEQLHNSPMNLGVRRLRKKLASSCSCRRRSSES